MISPVNIYCVTQLLWPVTDLPRRVELARGRADPGSPLAVRQGSLVLYSGSHTPYARSR